MQKNEEIRSCGRADSSLPPQDTTILYAKLPLLTCIYGALWTPFFLFDATVKAEAFDIGLVSIPSLLKAAYPLKLTPDLLKKALCHRHALPGAQILLPAFAVSQIVYSVAATTDAE